MMELLSASAPFCGGTSQEEAEVQEYRFQNLYVCPSKHIVRVNGWTFL